eukprot:scaffold37_cov138-Skeletonema_marinoi.AAC.2
MKVTSRRIPLKFQSVINNPNNNTTGGASSTAVPFPSVNATTLDPSSSAVATAENLGSMYTGERLKVIHCSG